MKLQLYISIILLSLVFSVNEKSYSQIPKWEWVKQIAGSLEDNSNSTAVDQFGNVFTTGYFKGKVDFDPGIGVFNKKATGNESAFISKLDSSGNFIWAKIIKGLGSCEAKSICLDAFGNVYVTGGFWGTIDFNPGPGKVNLTSLGSSDIFILKLDNYGNFEWAKQIGGTDTDIGNSITLDMKGNVYSTGTFYGTVDFNPGSGTSILSTASTNDIFISKLDSNGHFLWARQMSGGIYDGGNCIAIDNSGNVYTTGYFSGTVDFNPRAGVYNLTSAGSFDIFISKLDSSGNFKWARQVGSTGQDLGTSLAVSSSGNVYSIGNFYGTVDFNPRSGKFELSSVGSSDIYILKLDSSGNFVWARRVGTNYVDLGNSIALDALENVYFTGSCPGDADFDPGPGRFILPSNGYQDIIITKLDYSGNFLWAKSTGGTANDYGSSLYADYNGNVFITGRFWSPTISIDFFPFTLYNAGSSDVFIAKLSQKVCSVVTCTINPTINISRVTTDSCNNGKIIVNLFGGNFQAFAHIELYDSLNIKTNSANLASGTFNYVFKNLAPGSYTVKVFDNNCCEQDLSVLINCSSLTTGLKATNIKTTSAKLKWKVASCVVSYRVQYREQGTSAWNNRNVSGSKGYRTIINLTPSTTYEWRIANMCNGMSTYPLYTLSAIQTFTTLALPGNRNPKDLSEAESFEINLFPNPATYALTVNFETEETTARLKVINTVGKIIFEKQLQDDDGSYEEQLDISKYSNGMYVLLIETENSVSRKKFAKE